MSATNRLKRPPFEIYFNEYTEKYHLVRYTGFTKSGARSVKVIGRYDEYEDAHGKMIEIILEAEKK